jgi:hypothetical protein
VKRLVQGLLVLSAILTVLVAPPLAVRWWQERGEWFPMRVGDRWTYRDGSTGESIVFEAVRQNPDESFVVERRRGPETTTFVLSVGPESVFILETTGGRFAPPFEEFRLPRADGKEWSYDGTFGDRPVRIRSSCSGVERRRFEVREESSLSGNTTFTLERGKGVVRLYGKGNDVHGGQGARVFDWILEKFERRG